MKKTVLTLLFLSGILTANSGEIFNFEDGAAGGLVGNTAMYVYKKETKELPSTKFEAKLLALSGKSKICEDKQAKEMIKSGLKIQYVYVSDKRVAVVTIDNCD
jgi:hypothetical protein